MQYFNFNELRITLNFPCVKRDRQWPWLELPSSVLPGLPTLNMVTLVTTTTLLVLAASSLGDTGDSVLFPDQVKRGKTVRVQEDGDVAITISRKKWSKEKGRFLCCPLASKHCKVPCAGLSCEWCHVSRVTMITVTPR